MRYVIHRRAGDDAAKLLSAIVGEADVSPLLVAGAGG